MKTDAEVAREIRRKVKAICRALAWGGPKPTPEELAGRCRACLIAAASMRLIVGGLMSGEAADELAMAMTDAAFDAMEDALQEALALRN